ncbi:MAG: hypothetical protein HY554_14260 [Elusimicrobia bacterium]|nr:hypothetical protein [Elusimicrobiota bacterium]
MSATPPRGAGAGFTVMELLVALGVLSLLLMATAVGYSWTIREHQRALTELPMALGLANLDNIVRPALGSATCVRRPAAGFSSNVFLAYPTRDCAGNEALPAPAEGHGFFGFCLAGGVLLYARGPGTPSDAFNCDSGQVYALTPLGLAAATREGEPAVFRRDQGPQNVVTARLLLKDTAPSGSEVPSRSWEASALTQTPLSP